jgi:hypothetical protein
LPHETGYIETPELNELSFCPEIQEVPTLGKLVSILFAREINGMYLIVLSENCDLITI